jgi:hypothetical protein
MAGESDIITGLTALAEVSPTALVALLASAPALGSLWVVAKIIKGREAAPKEPEDHGDDLLREVQALHATVKATAAQMERGQASLLLEIVRQRGKE